MMLRFIVTVVVTATGYMSKLGSAVELVRTVKTVRAMVVPTTLLEFREIIPRLRERGGRGRTHRMRQLKTAMTKIFRCSPTCSSLKVKIGIAMFAKSRMTLAT